jgi:hypothetical protein
MMEESVEDKEEEEEEEEKYQSSYIDNQQDDDIPQPETISSSISGPRGLTFEKLDYKRREGKEKSLDNQLSQISFVNNVHLLTT